MQPNALAEKIIAVTGISADDIEKKVEEKQKELSGLISREGALYIIAKEAGIDILKQPKKTVQIKDLTADVRNVEIKARVFKIFGAREFERNGVKNKVVNILLADGTGTVRMSLWDKQTGLLENFKPGDAIEIIGAYTKDDERGYIEMRISKTGAIKKMETSDLPEIETISQQIIKQDYIANMQEGGIYEIRAAVVQIFESDQFYEICPSCGVRVKRDKDGFKCNTHGVVNPQFMMILSGILDDGTGNIRTVFFRNAAEKLIGMDTGKALEFGKDLSTAEIMGKEFVVVGRVRKNPTFKRIEFVASDVLPVDPVAESRKIMVKIKNK